MKSLLKYILFGTITLRPECCKDDYQSQWFNLKLDPTIQKWLNRALPHAKFHYDPLGGFRPPYRCNCLYPFFSFVGFPAS